MRLRPRPGFTLVELLVAVLLVDVALLSIVAAGAVAVRRQVETRTRAAAVQAAANRIQALAASPCVPATGSTRGERGLVEFWSADSAAHGQRQLHDSVAYRIGTSERSVVLRSRSPC